MLTADYPGYRFLLQDLLNTYSYDINLPFLVAIQPKSAARAISDGSENQGEESSLISPVATVVWFVVLSCLWVVVMAIFVVAKFRSRRSKGRTDINTSYRSLSNFRSSEDSLSLGSWSGEGSTCSRGVVFSGGRHSAGPLQAV